MSETDKLIKKAKKLAKEAGIPFEFVYDEKNKKIRSAEEIKKLCKSEESSSESDESSDDSDYVYEVDCIVSRHSKLPKHATEQSAGADLCIIDIDKDSRGEYKPVIGPNNKILGFKYRTGVKVALPEGTFGMLVPRSSFIKYNASMLNGVGIIDSDYRGEILIALRNNENPELPMSFNPDSPVFQLVVVPYRTCVYNRVDKFEEETERGEGGFGSTSK